MTQAERIESQFNAFLGLLTAAMLSAKDSPLYCGDHCRHLMRITVKKDTAVCVVCRDELHIPGTVAGLTIQGLDALEGT